MTKPEVKQANLRGSSMQFGVRGILPVLAIVALQLAWGTASAPAQCELEPLNNFFATDGGSQDFFGFAVSVDGTVAIVGAVSDDDASPGSPTCNSGSAYVFRFDGTTWVQEAKLTADDLACGDQFGTDVSISGDVAVVGAHWDLHAPGGGSSDGEGAAYVFRYDGAAWNQETKLTASDATTGDAYGNSVAIEGNVIVVGADHRYGDQAGHAYVYRFDGGEWVEESILSPWEGRGRDCFSYWGLDISGNTILVGAWGQEYSGEWGRGRVYVFRHDGTTWQEETALIASDAEYNDRFGIAVAVKDNLAVVGAYFEDEMADNCGAAYVFEFDGSAWNELTKLTPADGASWDWFGSSVDINDHVAVIGAWWDDDLGTSSGSAYVYQRDLGGADNWGLADKLVPSDGAGGDQFSYSISIDEDRMLVGSIKATGVGGDTGAVYEYRGLSDCNGNGTLDICDIADGTSLDVDGDGLPDECDCPGDIDGDNDVDLTDLAQLLANYGTVSGAAYEDGDLDGDGDVDLSDLAALLAVYGTAC